MSVLMKKLGKKEARALHSVIKTSREKRGYLVEYHKLRKSFPDAPFVNYLFLC